MMRKIIFIVLVLLSVITVRGNEAVYSLTVRVDSLCNSTGVVRYSLYNIDGSLPDENFERYYRQLECKIVGGEATVTFIDLPKGEYAVNVLHDEDGDGKIDMGWVLPEEGIGFSNMKKINPMNRPSFEKAKFELNSDKTIDVKIIYM